MTSRGEVVAIGEFKIRNSEEFPYEIPRFSYIIVKEAENTYASTCIDLHIDGDGATPDEAEANMGENVYDFLCVNFAKDRGNGPAWDYLKELYVIDENSKESWDVFSRYKLDLAKEGIKTDVACELMERVFSLKEEIDSLAKLNTTKEEELKVLRVRDDEQKEEIERLEQENQAILAAAKKKIEQLEQEKKMILAAAIKFTADVREHYEMYGWSEYNWSETR